MSGYRQNFGPKIKDGGNVCNKVTMRITILLVWSVLGLPCDLPCSSCFYLSDIYSTSYIITCVCR